MFRNLSLTFNVLDFRVIGRWRNLLVTIICLFLRFKHKLFYFFYVKVFRRIFGFRILRNTQAKKLYYKLLKIITIINIRY